MKQTSVPPVRNIALLKIYFAKYYIDSVIHTPLLKNSGHKNTIN
jgi:hypothetical protein